jgi:hypothetical protein
MAGPSPFLLDRLHKWIKQNLKIKSFFGTSENAARIQVWCALCVYLMVAHLKFLSKSPFSLSKLLVRIRANLMERIGLVMVLYHQEIGTHNAAMEQQLTLTYVV